jgi:hypothetical protein
MSTHVINAEHVLLALVALRAKRMNPTIARFAAISNGAMTTRRCTTRDARSRVPHSVWRTPPMLYPLLPSVPASLVEHVRVFHGLLEVKKTWGIGYKALLAEVSPKPKAITGA